MTEQLVGEFNSLLLFDELFVVLPDNLGDWAKCFIKMLRLFKYEASEVMTSNMASCNFLASKLMLFKMPLFITSGSSDHIDLRPPVQAEVRSMAEGRVRDLFKVLVSISRPSSDSWLPKRYMYINFKSHRPVYVVSRAADIVLVNYLVATCTLWTGKTTGKILLRKIMSSRGHIKRDLWIVNVHSRTIKITGQITN